MTTTKRIALVTGGAQGLGRAIAEQLGEDGASVVIGDVDKDEMMSYTMVTSEDVDVSKGMISTTSPIGRGLLGKKVGDTVKIQVPGGAREMEIVELLTIHQNGKAS